MKRFRLFTRSSRGAGYYYYDSVTKKHKSLRTKDREEADILIHNMNEAERQPSLNFRLAKTYLAASDPQCSKRNWRDAFKALIDTKHGQTQTRWLTAEKDRAFDLLRDIVLLETRPEHLIAVLKNGTVSTNSFLRKLHNFCVDMSWLPTPVIPKKQWPPIRYKEKRAITLEEHQKIVGRERNPERQAYYQLCWHLGGSQSDVAALQSDDINWRDRIITYRRQKNGASVLIHFGPEAAAVLQTLPKTGPLFPRFGRLHEKHRAKEFKRRCQSVGVSGVSLHCYRYSWAERGRTCGMPERFAQEALGHNSKAVHRAYAKRALVKVPSLEEYEKNIVQVEFQPEQMKAPLTTAQQ